MPPARKSRALLAALVALLALAACTGSDNPPSADNTLTFHRGVGAGLTGVGHLPTPATAWPQAGFDARHSSATPSIGPQTAEVRWARPLGGNVTPGPVIEVDGSVLAATNAGVLHDLEATTGADVWTFDGGGGYGIDLSTSPAVLANGTVLWPGPNSTLFALAANGTLLWKETFSGQVLSPAVAGRNRVYVADMSGRLEALEVTAKTHRVVWKLDVGGVDYASPTVGQNGTIYTASDQDLVAVRDLGAKGAELFRFHAKKMVEVSNAVAPDGSVVLGTNHDKEFGISPAGKVRWAYDVGDYTYSSSIVAPDGIGYFGDNMGRMRVIDTRTGKVSATIAPLGAGKEKIWTSAAVDSKGNFYWGTTEGNVYGYAADGHQLFHLHASGGIDSYPALDATGALYFGTTDGTFYSVGQ